MDVSAGIADIDNALSMLVDQKKLYRMDGLYALRNDAFLVLRRREGNARAAALLPLAYRIGRLLSKFPFVRGVGISGSLSKEMADETADIDFFIITETNRLWISRTLLHCLKKLSFLAGKQHWLCMNYFVDRSALHMPEQNIFIATEVLTLKPVTGNALPVFFVANRWALRYFPNYRHETLLRSLPVQEPWYKKAMEKLFYGRIGDWLDDYLMRLTQKRWEEKERKNKRNIKGLPLSLRVGKHFGRPNPDHFQKKVLNMYAQQLKRLHHEQSVEVIAMQDHFLRREII